jgi:hypothetical protein
VDFKYGLGGQNIILLTHESERPQIHICFSFLVSTINSQTLSLITEINDETFKNYLKGNLG